MGYDLQTFETIRDVTFADAAEQTGDLLRFGFIDYQGNVISLNIPGLFDDLIDAIVEDMSNSRHPIGERIDARCLISLCQGHPLHAGHLRSSIECLNSLVDERLPDHLKTGTALGSMLVALQAHMTAAWWWFLQSSLRPAQ